MSDLLNRMSSSFKSGMNKVTGMFSSSANATGGRRTKRRGYKRGGTRRRMRGGSTVQSYDSEPTMASVGSSYTLGPQSAGRRRRRKHRRSGGRK